MDIIVTVGVILKNSDVIMIIYRTSLGDGECFSDVAEPSMVNYPWMESCGDCEGW